MKNLDITYRTSPRRRSIGLQVTATGRVVVTMPRGTSEAGLVRALEKHRAWIERQVAARRAAWGQIQAGQAYFLGQAFRLTVLQGAPGAVTVNENEMRVPVPAGENLWNRLTAWYVERAAALLRDRVGRFGAAMGLKPGPVQLKGWKRRWGQCHPDGNLKFNWRLILCPPPVVDYVVVHELAHLRVAGHNPRFWAQVAGVLPDYAARRRWLNWDGAVFLDWRLE